VTVRREAPVWLVGAAGTAITAAFALRLLLPNAMDPSVFLALGRDSVQTSYARELLGDVWTRPGLGHDGRFFFVQANDPWIVEPDAHAALLDRPIYRSQRMLFPMIAGGFGLLPPSAIVWSMLITNMAAMVVGTILAAKLAAAWDIPIWLGLLVPLNIGLLFELEIGGAGILAYACCLGALHALLSERTWLASSLFAAAALSREVMVAFAVGVFVLWWLERRERPWRLLIAPLAAMAVWLAYVRYRLGGVTGVGDARGAFAAPFMGVLEAFRSWSRTPWHLVINVTLLSVVILFVPLALRSRLSIAWGAVPFAGLAMVLSADVWGQTFDLTRALAPVFTAAPFLLVFSERQRSRSSAGRLASEEP
jgi:hypothetical protein